MPTADQLDRRIRAIGHDIFDRARLAEPSPLRQAWWQQQMLEWIMRDDVLKTQLFRFIEALPKLRGPRAVASHLKQYLRGGPRNGHPLPGIVDLVTGYRSDESLHARLMALLARTGSLQMAGTFIAGHTAEEAIASVVKLRRARMTFTLDVLGETVLCAGDADHVQQVYLDLINAMAAAAPTWRSNPQLDDSPMGPLPRVNLSIKLSALAPRFDAIAADQMATIVLGRLRPVLRLARLRGAFINVDLEHYAFKDITYAMFKQVLMEPEFRDWPHAGIVVQAYLRDSEDELRELIDWTRQRGTPITVRLVKGAYWDHETALARSHRWPIPVWTQKWQSDRNYERLGRILLEHRQWTLPAFASHNVRSLAAMLAYAESLHLPPRLLEVQMLYGMGEPLKQALIGMGQRVRVYTPFGDLMPGMAYFMRRLLENTANEGFLKQSFSDDVPESILLAEPAPRGGTPTTTSQTSEATEPETPLDELAFHNEPLSDFSQTCVRDSLTAALRADPVEMQCRGLMGGTASGGKPTRTLVNPSHPLQIIARVTMAEASDVQRAANAAAGAFSEWAVQSTTARSQRLIDAAARIRQRRVELTALVIRTLGKTWRDADAEVAGMIDALAFYAHAIRTFESQSCRLTLTNESHDMRWQPRGVVAVVTGTSSPGAGAVELVAGALAAGNSVVWLPDMRVAPVADAVVRLIHEAGVPGGSLNVLYGEAAVVSALVADTQVASVVVRGPRTLAASVELAAGTARDRSAARQVVVWADGPGMVIVDDDTDIDEAVLGALASALTFAGQASAVAPLVVVVGDAYQPFVERLTATARELSVGAADDPSTTIGPVLDVARRTEAVARVAELRRLGTCVVDRHSASETTPGMACLAGPFVFVDVPLDALPPGEFVGPVLCVERAADLSHAIRLANQHANNGNVTVFSRGPDHMERVKAEVRAGRLFVNRPVSAGAIGSQRADGRPVQAVSGVASPSGLLSEFMDRRRESENVLRRPAVATAKARVRERRAK